MDARRGLRISNVSEIRECKKRSAGIFVADSVGKKEKRNCWKEIRQRVRSPSEGHLGYDEDEESRGSRFD